MNEEYLKHFDLSISDDIKSFVEGTLKDKEYLFVRNEYEYDPLSNSKEKVQYGYCSHCRKEYRTEYHLKHNEIVVCPECGAEIKVKDIRYGKKCLMNDFCFYYFDKSIINLNVVTCKGYYFKKYYDDYKNPQYEYILKAVYIFDLNTGKSKMLKQDWWSNGLNETASVYDFDINGLANVEMYIAEDSLKRAVEGTRFQYCNYERKDMHVSIVRYLDKINKYPWIEQLEKMGFIKIAKTLIKGDSTFYCINYKGKDIFKKLKLNRGEVKKLDRQTKCELEPRSLRMYQINRDNGFKGTIEEARSMYKMVWFSSVEINYLLKNIGINKILKYVSKQYEEYNNNSYYNECGVINKWDDYLKNCKKLNWDITNKSILFPKDLIKAHNHTNSLINAEKNKGHDKKIRRRLPALKKKYFFKDNDFFIRPAESSEDLINEGGTLNHCVAVHYMKPYAEATTDILMIRRCNEPNTPLVTVEVKDGVVRQAYGKNDTRPKKDVLEFIEKFKIEILENLKSNKKNKKKGKAA